MADLGPDEATGGGSRPTSPARVEESVVDDAVEQPMEGVQDADGDEVLMARIAALTQGVDESGAVSAVSDEEAAGGGDGDADSEEAPPSHRAWSDQVQQEEEEEEQGRDVATISPKPDGSKAPQVAAGGARRRGPDLKRLPTEKEERQFFAEPYTRQVLYANRYVGSTPRKASVIWRTTSLDYPNIRTRSRGSQGMEACGHLSGWHGLPMIFARGTRNRS